MNRENIENIRQNINFLSSLAKFNSERNDSILQFYENIIETGIISSKKLELNNLINYVQKKKKKRKNEIPIESLSKVFLYTFPTNIHYGWNLSFATTRYEIVKKEFYQKYRFKIKTLGIFEEALYSLIFSRSDSYSSLDSIYQFEDEEEYSSKTCIKEPDYVFYINWINCITIDLEAFIARFIASISQNYMMLSALVQDNPEKEPKEILHQIEEEVLEIINLVSIKATDINTENISILQKPLFYFEGENGKKTIIVPFPRILCSTIHLRLANLVSQDEKLEAIEEQRKGRVVEKFANTILNSIPNKNIVKNFTYFENEKQFESDILLVLANSIWTIEVKSHPIFKKIISKAESLVKNFSHKFNEGINQGIRTLDYLNNNPSILKQLNFKKNFLKSERGIIVVLDGYIPTLLTQNKPADKLMGTYDIYKNIPKDIRFYVISMFELNILSLQSDISNFEEFLLWRTGYKDTMPICCYDEKDYWAYYNDRYLENEDNKKLFDEMLSRQEKQEVMCNYISYRFNRKEHLGKEPLRKNNLTKKKLSENNL